VNSGNGGGGQNNNSAVGNGGSGVVIVAYQIGTSSAEEIANAAAIRKAQLRKSQLEEKARMKKEAQAAKLRK
jgi:hypothetical protein